MKKPIENYVEGSFVFSDTKEACMRGSSKELLAMTLGIIYGLLKARREEITPVQLMKGISNVMRFINLEEDNYSRFDDEVLPLDIEAEIDQTFDDLAELLGGSDDHCS